MTRREQFFSLPIVDSPNNLSAVTGKSRLNLAPIDGDDILMALDKDGRLWHRTANNERYTDD